MSNEKVEVYKDELMNLLESNKEKDKLIEVCEDRLISIKDLLRQISIFGIFLGFLIFGSYIYTVYIYQDALNTLNSELQETLIHIEKIDNKLGKMIKD